MKTLSKAEFKRVLENFTGSDTRYIHKLFNGLKMALTEGCKYVADEAEAYWLFDLILSYQYTTKVRNEPFQVWQLKKIADNKKNYWEIVCTDGNDNKLAKQIIEYSDFPLESFTVWYIEGVALLPTEY